MNFTNRLIQERTLCEPSSVQPRPPCQPGRLLYGTSSCVRSLMLPRQTTLQLRCQQQQITTTTMGVFVHKNVRVCVCVAHLLLGCILCACFSLPRNVATLPAMQCESFEPQLSLLSLMSAPLPFPPHPATVSLPHALAEPRCHGAYVQYFCLLQRRN